ncbi:MAG: isoamylase [Treponema sp.]|jgi:hypothetical protein|nr:isoamylase [Treponema sp.]
MKTILSGRSGTCLLIIIFAFFPVNSLSADWETYELIDKLLTLPGPGAPVIHDNYVIFTASSQIRRVGVSFAHENFSSVYWYRQLLIPQDRLGAEILPGEKTVRPYKDSGLQFHVYKVPENLSELEYRIIINGLWTTDPDNSRSRRDPVSGLSMSVLSVPPGIITHDPLRGLPNGLNFVYNAPPGETVTIAGDFNGWDPFMYELKEGPQGVYSISLPLAKGAYQYVFFHRGRRYTDPSNPRRIYAKDGSAASVIVVP